MKLLDISIENFMGLTGEQQLVLNNLGLTHIRGLNLDDPGNDSNGSCKTTILEALTWCLFGEGLPRPTGNTEQGIRADEVLNDLKPKQCRVVSRCQDEETGDVFEVARWRKWKKGKGRALNGQSITVNGETSEALDEKETNRLIEKHLGITREIWCRGVVFGQESTFNFCDATTKKRNEILTTVMGLEAVDTWQERCRDDKRALTNKLAESGGKVEVMKNSIARAKEQDPKAQVEQWDLEQSQRIQASEKKLKEIEEYGQKTKQELASLGEFTEPAPQMPQSNIQAMVEEVQRLRQECLDVSEECARCQARFDWVTNEIDNVIGRGAQGVVGPLPDLDELLAKVNHFVKERNEAGEQIGYWRGQLAQVDQESEQLASMPVGVSCPTCRQPITAQHAEACRNEVRDRREGILLELEAAKRLESEVMGWFARADQSYKQAEQTYALIAQQNERHERRAELQDEQAQLFASLKGLKQKVAEALESHSKAEQQLQAVQAHEREVLAAQSGWERRRAEFLAEQRRLEGLVINARQDWAKQNQWTVDLKGQINPYAQAVEDHQKYLEKLTSDLKELEADQVQIAGKLDMCQWWDRELPRFKTWLFDSVVDTLASEANRWLRVMSGGVLWIQISTQVQKGKRIKDELDVQIYRWNPDGTITSRPYRVWSGGEKRRVALAVDLGLSRLMSNRASKAYRFLALDEIDRHLDAQGREGLRQVLDELRTEKETCFVITHDPEFRASFDQEILVTKQGGHSRMEMSDGREAQEAEAQAGS